MSDSIVDDVLHARYYQPGETSWEDVARRVANYIGDTDAERGEYFRLIRDKVFLPNSPCLMNAGTAVPMMSACFVEPIEDSMESIFETLKNTALIHKTGGGTGFNFGTLRPEGDLVRTTRGIASGPISFMKVFNTATGAVIQGGTRRGANMGILPIWHPDIEKFVECKTHEGELSNFNISVMVDNKFMEAVESDGDYELVFNDVVYKTIKARKLFSSIVRGAWKNGEPGILFYDTINADNPFYPERPITATNPCAEEPLLPYESCTLASINVSKFVTDGKFDWNAYIKVIVTVTKFLNGVIDKNEYPIPEIREASLSTRKIGIGLMGFHDALITLNIPYDSIDAREFGKALMKYMDEWSHLTSDECNFNNVATTTIAPTGTIATIAQCSYGIEPNFSYVHVRNTWVSGEKVSYKQIHPLFENALLKQFPDDMEMRNCIISHMFEHGTIQDLIDLPKEFRDIFKTAMDISWNDHVMMQSAFQKYCDAGISKTINMQNSALESDVEQAIITAWKLGCKGITIYRSGSRETEVLELAKSSPKMEDVIMPKEEIPRRQKILNGTTYKMQSGCGKLYITINEHNGRPYEVFVQTAGSGGCQANSEAIGRLISLALRNGVPSKEIIKQLKRVKCAAAIKSGCDGKSCADIIAKCIEEFYSVIEEEGDSDISTIVPDENLTIPVDTYRPKCPECGEPLTLAEGCMVCGSCGWSKCK